MKQLDGLLKRTGLRSDDDTASAIFSQIVNLFKRITNPKSAGITVTITPEGLPIVAPQIEFGDRSEPQELVRHDDALRLLNDGLTELGFRAWVVLDRLDEAFQGFPDAEIPVLRALLRTHLDLGAFDHLTLKLFVRKDLRTATSLYPQAIILRSTSKLAGDEREVGRRLDSSRFEVQLLYSKPPTGVSASE
jgi:hypothetical protein